jgi:undecaprenyl-diphosphatase
VTWSAAALLGIVQGLTEFLPVSSSAHLILFRAIFGWTGNADVMELFDVAVHVGTLLAVVVFFRRDLLALIAAVPHVITHVAAAPRVVIKEIAAPRAPTPLKAPGTMDVDGRRLLLIAVGTVPIVIAGLLHATDLEDTLRTPVIAASMLALGAFVLFAGEHLGQGTKREPELGMASAFVVGVAQAAALVPGVSRSGATIGVGMLLGFERATITRFSFLLSVPAILAAAAHEGWKMRHMALTGADVQMLAIGIVTSAVVGYLAVAYFIRFVSTRRLDVFAWYRLALAAVLLVWLR